MKLRKILATSVIAFVIAGCGGGGGNTPTQNTGNNGGTNNPPVTQNNKLTSGKVSDGYIAGANVLVDINTSTKGAYDSGDYNTTTNANGDFDIPSKIAVPNGTVIYANGGIVVSTGKDFNGTLKGVFDGQKSSIVLSPVTTMVATLIQDNNITPEQAKEKVATALNIPKDKVTADPVSDPDALKAVQKVVAIAKVVQTDSNKSVSDIIEDIAKKLNNDSNLTKAVKDSTNNEDLAKAALDTAKAVEEAIDNLQKDENSSNSAIEQAVQEHIVDKAKEAAENDENVTQVLSEAKANIEDNNFQDVVKAASCLTFDKIKGNNSDINSVVTDLNLTAKSECKDTNLTIAWVNSSSNIDLSSGAVTRANYDNNLSFVEANVTKGDKSQIKPIFFTVLAKGQRPIAVADTATVQEDSNITIDVLANDTDDNKSELNVSITTDPTNGVATLTDNKIVYTPNANFNGIDTLTYSLLDPYGAESNATVTITVTPKNDAPVLDDLPALPSIPEDSNATTITLHATDIDINDTITYSATSSNPAIATVSVSGDQLTVTPQANANGDVNITVTATDSQGASDSKTVTLHINPVNDAPVLDNLPALPSIPEDSNATTITLHATDIDINDTITYSATSSNPAIATVSVSGDQLTVTPQANANGDVNITVTATDSQGASDSKTVTLHINPVNDAPVLNNIPNNPTINEDAQPFQVELNATDADHDNLEFSATSSDTSIAQVSVNGNILTITPQPNANGDVDITVTVTDNNGGSDSKTVTLHINPLNDAPVAVNDTISVTSNAVALIDVLANDSDIDSPTLTITSVKQPADGNVSIVNNKIQFTPPADFNGTVTFSYTISDDQNATATATVTVDIVQYVTAMTKAINQVNNFDKENGNFNSLLNNVKTTLENADANETDAQVGLAIVELAETINDDMPNFIAINGQQASIDDLLSKENGAKAVLSIVGDLSDQTETSLHDLATNLKNIADKIDALLATNPDYEFKYKDFTLSSDDLKALSGALDLKAALLEYGAAYKPAKKEYVNTTNVDINGTTVEYQVYKADPKTVLNDPETLSLNGNAQNHFDTSKSELQRAINKLASVDIGNVKNKFRSKLDDIQGKLTDLNNSLNGVTDFILEQGQNKTYINVSALFQEATAPTLGSILGNDIKYISDDCDADYNATLSMLKNMPMGICKDKFVYLSDGTPLPITTKLFIEPNTVPMGNSNHLTSIVTKIVANGRIYTGDDILHKMLGDINIQSNGNMNNYNSLSDVNITYTIENGPTGSTAPYSCEVEDIAFWDNQGNYIDVNHNLLTVSVDGNTCQLNVDPSYAPSTEGSIFYGIVIKDNYGHDEEIYNNFNFGNQNGGDTTDQNGTNGDNNATLDHNNSLTQSEYENFNPSSVIPNGDYYDIELENQHIAYYMHIQINDDNIVVQENNYDTETLNKEINSQTNELIAKDGDNNVIAKVKYVRDLNSTALNNFYNTNIFGNGDSGYLIYQAEYDENPTNYEKVLWLNSSANEKIQSAFSNGGDNNDSNIDFENDINATVYNNTKAIYVPDFPLYTLEYSEYNNNPELTVNRFTIDDSSHITKTKYINGDVNETNTVSYSIDDQNIISISFVNDLSNPNLKIKFTQELSNTDLNNIIGQNIFNSGDKGYRIMEHNIHDTNSNQEYFSNIWFNDSAKNSFVQFIQQNSN